MTEAEERKAYDDWLHQSPEFADTIISAWDVWMGRAALSAQPEPAAPTEPAPGWCKHCQQYTIEEPLPAVKPDVPAANFGNMEPVAWIFMPNNELLWPAEVEATNPIEIDSYRPLYTHPPRREWVSLTEEEREAAIK